MEPITVFWFRRDLRLEDNRGLHEALKSGRRVLPVFIFDTDITDRLSKDDARVQFIHESLTQIHEVLAKQGSGLFIRQGRPKDVWAELLEAYPIEAVYTNEDYEPYSIRRDVEVAQVCAAGGVAFHSYKDHVVFAKDEVMKKDGRPYTVFTPYMRTWRSQFTDEMIIDYSVDVSSGFMPIQTDMPTLEDLGYECSTIRVKSYRLDCLDQYAIERDRPAIPGTSLLGPHLRFGTIGVRQVMRLLWSSTTFVNELIWRSFFQQILYHFPHVVSQSFKSQYDSIPWRDAPDDFTRWQAGATGYPLVDAGMRELEQTGYMHNRVRMVVASFLCKHLLIDWRWGEAYFAEKLLDYELASNNGNWQWAASSGCDAAPYFRIFNPTTQLQKFDPEMNYVRKWVPEVDHPTYARPMVDHKMARARALSTYKAALARIDS